MAANDFEFGNGLGDAGVQIAALIDCRAAISTRARVSILATSSSMRSVSARARSLPA